MLFSSLGLQQPVKSLEVDGFVITERLHPPDNTLPRHEHEVAIVSLLLKGSITESVDRHTYECPPHSLQILPAGEPHSYRFGRHYVHCLTVEVKPQRLERIRLFSNILDRTNHLSGGVMPALQTRLYKEFRLGDDTSILTIEGLLLETLGSAETNTRCKTSVEPFWLRLVRDFIHDHFTERLSLTGLAALAEVHPSHLARIFREHYGCSVGDYIRRLRLDYAARELATDKPMAEIAIAAGFYDQSHFTHAFKLRMKMTPAQYRAAARLKLR
jgi:AraC family transcriptional regulator